MPRGSSVQVQYTCVNGKHHRNTWYLSSLRWMELASKPEGVEILLVTSCYWNWDKLQPKGPLSLCADLFYWRLDEWRLIIFFLTSSSSLSASLIRSELDCNTANTACLLSRYYLIITIYRFSQVYGAPGPGCSKPDLLALGKWKFWM